MPLALDQFSRRVVESGLLSETELQRFVQALAEDQRPQDGQQLARLLVKQNKLTAYQAQEIYKGNGRGLVLGNYVVLDKLGQGGMGLVLKAEHRRMKRVVAVKVLSPAALRSPESVARFHREVEAAARLEHPNIVAAHDADESGGTHFLVMQYVDGSDLSTLVKRSGPLSVEQAVDCIEQAARGLEYAHREGVVHRDIKPANLLLDKKGTVKILDMGLARLEGSAVGGQADLTGTGQIMGTIDYMSPEQALNTKNADQRADIYSLGITLWYLLTGRAAYGGDTLMEKIMAHQSQPIPSLREVCPAVSPELDAVFRRMVAKSPADRYQTMEEVLAALAGCGARGSGPALLLPRAISSEDRRLSDFLPSASGSAAVATPPAVNQAEATLAPQVTLIVGAESAGELPKVAEPVPKMVHRPPRLASKPPRKFALLAGASAAIALLAILPLAVWAFMLLGAGAKSKDGEIKGPAKDGAVAGNSPGSPGKGQNAAVRSAYALEFDGVDDYVEIPTLHLLGSQPLTIELLVTPAGQPTGRETVIFVTGASRISVGTRGLGWGTTIHTPRGNHGRYGDGVMSPGRTDHVAAVFEQRNLLLFVNGQTVGRVGEVSRPQGGAVSILGAGYGEGRSPPRAHYFQGALHGVRISRSFRYAQPFTAPKQLDSDSNTIALYLFHEGIGNELKDASGNGHHGTIHGARWVLADPFVTGAPRDALAAARADSSFKLPEGWQWNGTSLVSDASITTHNLPLKKLDRAGYSLDLEFSLQEGSDALFVMLPLGNGRHCLFGANAYPENGQALAGFGSIRGETIRENKSRISHTPFRAGERHRASVSVIVEGERASLLARLDSQSIAYEGPVGDLSVPPEYSWPDAGYWGLGTVNSRYEVSSLRLGETLR